MEEKQTNNQVQSDTNKPKQKKNTIKMVLIAVAIVAMVCVYALVIQPNSVKKQIYDKGLDSLAAENVIKASYYFDKAGDYKDASEKEKECHDEIINEITKYLDSEDNDSLTTVINNIIENSKFVTEDFDNALRAYADEEINNGDSSRVIKVVKCFGLDYLGEDYKERYENAIISIANEFFDRGYYEEAMPYYLDLGERGVERYAECHYCRGQYYQKMDYFSEAIESYLNVPQNCTFYSPANDRLMECKYGQVKMSFNYDGDLNTVERGYLKELYNDIVYYQRVVAPIYKAIFKHY